MSQTPAEVLDSILGYLGFVGEIQEQERDGSLVLQILTHEPDRLIGRNDIVLDDLQYLVNRVLAAQSVEFQRVTVDVEHHRAMRDDVLVGKVRHLAQAVRSTKRSLQTEPLNSYDRRIVHNAFKDDPEITTWSPKDDARVKRITLRTRPSV